MNYGIAFSGWLKARRKEQGIGHDEFADRISCSRIALLKMESGERRPSRQMALLLAQYFHIPEDEHEAFVIFARAGQASSPTGEAPGSEAAARSPWRLGHLHKTNLPYLLTPLFGRERDEELARSHLLQQRVRILTLTGPPGIGKTRLATRVASGLLDQYDDGVYFVDLSPVIDPDDVPATIARSIGLTATGGVPISAALEEYLSKRRMLLLLDNFEQLLDAAITVVKLLEVSPWLKVLITSREALNVRGERRFVVQPLATPLKGQSYSPSALIKIPSVELFINRAQPTDSGFELTDENAQEVAMLCSNLDGLPLAIELAAARVKHMEPSMLLARMGEQHQLGVLTSGLRDLPPRQRTLRGAIAWSYNLLSETEQHAFRHLGVFVGGFTPQAVDAVMSGSSGSAGSGDSLELLLSLADKNLIKGESLGPEARFHMLESIREYAQEQLAAHGKEEDARRQHSLYMMSFAEEGESHLSGARQIEWLRRLDADYDNLKSAIIWAVEAGDGETALRLAGALGSFWMTRAYYSEGRDLISLMLALSGPTIHRARALNVAGHMATQQGDYSNARSLFDESLLLSQETNDQEGVGDTLEGLGALAIFEGDFSSARSLLGQTLALWQKLDAKGKKAQTLANLVLLADRRNDWHAHRAYSEEAVQLMRELHNSWGLARALSNLGVQTREYYADFRAARQIAEETLELNRQLGNKRGIGNAFANLGLASHALGELLKAKSFYEQALEHFRDVGHKQLLAETYTNLSETVRCLGDYRLAQSLIEQGLAIRETLNAHGDIAHSLYMFALVVACQGNFDEAMRLMEKSETFYREAGSEAVIGGGLGDLSLIARCKGELGRALEVTDRRLAWYQSQEGEVNRLLEAYLYHERGMVRWLQGAGEDAEVHLQDALRTFSRLECNYDVARCLLALGGLAAPHSPRRAARLVGASDVLFSSNGGRVFPFDEAVWRDALAEARLHLGAVRWQASHDEGRALPLESAVQYALGL